MKKEENVDLDVFCGDNLSFKKYITLKTGKYDISTYCFDVNSIEEFINFLIKRNFAIIYSYKSGVCKKKDKINFDAKFLIKFILGNGEFSLISPDNEIIFYFSSYMSISTKKLETSCILYNVISTTKENLNLINEILNKFEKEKVINNNVTQFNMILINEYGNFELKEIDVNKVVIKESYYNNNIDFSKLFDILKSDKNGIVIFSGIAGSGKTTLIKHLKQNSDKNFIMIPVKLFSSLTNPQFAKFAVQNFKDCVLVVEDCEALILSRDNNYNDSMSELLNLGDGILGSSLNLKIILTYNTENNIDKAILRKGRTVFMHRFEKVLPEYANEISKELGYNITYNEPVSLCDIFNQDECGEIGKKSKKIGF